MSAAPHISWDELNEEMRALIEHSSRNGVFFIDGAGKNFLVSVQQLRTASEILADLESGPAANLELDDEWSSDMEKVMRENRAHDRDPWAE